MSAGSDKTLKIQASVDTASFAKATAAISSLTREVERLVIATSKINFGGGGMGMKMSSNTPQSGGPSSIAQMTSKFGTGSGGGQGGVANSLAQAVVQSTALFKTAAAGSKDAFKGMQDNLRALVQTSTREIATLTTSLTRLETVFNRFRGGGMGGGQRALPAVGGGGGYGRVIDVEGRSVGGGPRMLGPMGGGRGAAGGGVIPPSGGVTATGGGGGWGMGGVMRMLGLGTGIGGLAYGAMKAVNFGLSSAYENKEANLQYGLGLQTQTLQRQATFGNIYGGNAVALSHGDIALSHAMRVAAKDKDYAQATSMKAVEAQKQIINLQKPTDWKGNVLKEGVLSGSWGYLKSKLGPQLTTGSVSAPGADVIWRNPATGREETHRAGWQAPGSAGAVGNGLGADFNGRTVGQIANDIEKNKLPEQIAQKRQDALQMIMQRNPLLNNRMQDYYNNSMGDIGLARMAHIGGGLVRDPKTASFSNPQGYFGGDAVTSFKARNERAGYDSGLVGGMMAQMNAQLGMGRGGEGAARGMLGKQAAGFSSVMNVAAMGGQFGQAGLAGSISGRGGLIGGGGLNISAGSQIFGLGAGMMGSGNFAGKGSGLMETLAAAGSTGNVGGDMRMARMMESGMGALGNVMSGGVDNLQKGMNAAAAMGAAPGAGYSVHETLMSMDPGTMMAALANDGKNFPQALLKQGVTKEILKKYMGATLGTSLLVRSVGTEGTEIGNAQDRFRASGGNMDYTKGWSLKRKRDEINTLGIGARKAGIAPTNEAGEAMFAAIAGISGALKKPKGAGAFAVKAKGPRAEALKTQGDLTEAGGKGVAKNSQTTTDAFGNVVPAQEASEGQRQDAQQDAARGAGAGVEGALSGLDAAFRSFIAALRGDPQILGSKTGAPSRARPPGTGR